MTEKEVLEFAKENGYKRVIYEMHWKDYDVYSASHYDDDIPRIIGLPHFILVKDNNAEYADFDQVFEILKDLPAD